MYRALSDVSEMNGGEHISKTEKTLDKAKRLITLY
jgi:hypothetical protein